MDYLTLMALAAENPHGRLEVTPESARTHFVFHAKCFVAAVHVIPGILAANKVRTSAPLPAPCWQCDGMDFTPWAS